jgi:hypothetical protein
MQLVLVLTLIILAIFIIGILMTFVFHLIMFKFIVPFATTEKIDGQQNVSEELFFLDTR